MTGETMRISADVPNGDSVFVDGERLKQLRQSCHWTQEQAAEKAGYTDRLIRKLERGGPVNIQTLRNVVEAYHEESGLSIRVAAESFIREENRAMMESLSRQWFESILIKRNVNAIDQLVAANAKLFAEGTAFHGRAAIRERLQTVLDAFNPLCVSAEQVLVDGNSTAVFWLKRAKHIGTFLGIPATNRWVTLRGCFHARFQNRQITEARDHWDIHNLLISSIQHDSCVT